MTKSLQELAEENDRIELEPAEFDCYNCGNPEVTVYLREDGYKRQWPACLSCGSRANYALSGLSNRGIEIYDE